MSDTTVPKRLAAYAARLSFDDLPADVVHQAKRLTVDCMGCGLGGFDSEPGKIARDLASSVTGRDVATVLGTKSTSTVDLAAFANGTMVRFLDFNDAYSGLDTGHPSDCVPAMLAAAEASGMDGKAVILGIVLSYEIQAAWCDTWDGDPFEGSVMGSIALPLAIGKIMGLSEEQLAHAVQLCVGFGPTLGGAPGGRGGTVCNFKASRMANSARNAIFAVQLAERGFTGATYIFEAPGGYYEAVVRKTVTMSPLTGDPDRKEGFRIMKSNVKRFPSGFPSQEFIEATLDCRKALGIENADDVARVHVRTYKKGMSALFLDRTRWRPENRETADHSGPFVVACALRHGWVDSSNFERDEFLAPDTIALMDRVTAELDQECEAAYPGALLNIVTVETTDGRSHTARVPYHRGHHKNPMTDDDLEAKFVGLTRNALTPVRQRAALDSLWRLDEISALTPMMHLLAI